MILDAFRLDGKTAIVTGAGRGIGAEIARSFAEVGAAVVCVARTREELLRTCGAIEAMGGRAIPVDCDLVAGDSAELIVEAGLAAYGRIDVLVNNAGGGGHVPTRHAADAHFDAAMALNFKVPFYLTRAVAPHMKVRGGAVVNISSGFARAANVGSIPYGGAKAALEQLTRMMAMEYAPAIRVNGIRVGAVTTENMQRNLLDAMPGISEKLAAWTPLQRHGTPADIAQAALFLASPASSFVTARILPVDGGVVLERSAMELIARAEKMAKD